MWKNILLGTLIATTIALFVATCYLGYKWQDCSAKLVIAEHTISVSSQSIAEKDKIIKEQARIIEEARRGKAGTGEEK